MTINPRKKVTPAVFDSTDIPLMARVHGLDNTPVQQADLSALTFIAYIKGAVPGSPTSLTIANVIFDTLRVPSDDLAWTEDGRGGTDLIIHASDSTKVRPASGGVVAGDVGLPIQITAGTGFTVGVYRVNAQDGTYWTLSSVAGTVGSTGGTYRLGGYNFKHELPASSIPAEGVYYVDYEATASGKKVAWGFEVNVIGR